MLKLLRQIPPQRTEEEEKQIMKKQFDAKYGLDRCKTVYQHNKSMSKQW